MTGPFTSTGREAFLEWWRYTGCPPLSRIAAESNGVVSRQTLDAIKNGTSRGLTNAVSCWLWDRMGINPKAWLDVRPL